MTSQTELLARENDAEMARLTGIIFDLMKALNWIANNPGAHPANMVAVAKAALDAVGGSSK